MSSNVNQTDGDALSLKFGKWSITPPDEAEEVAMLRSRIDEQGQLICILKKRADEYVIRNQTLEKINNELEILRQQAIEDYNSEMKKSEMLELRFNELAENHEEMIKYKDEHKRRNELLTEENARLLKENKTLFSGAIQEKNKTIESLQATILQLKERLVNSVKEEKALNRILEDTNKNLKQQVEKLKKELEETSKKLKMAQNALSKAKAERDVAQTQKVEEVVKLRKENEDLLNQVMQRGKLLQDRQDDIERLEKEVQLKDEEVEEAEEKFRTMEDRVNVNARVKRLQAERDIADTELSQLRREYEAFRVHSNKLLSQEKELNYKLRHNILA